MTRRTEEEKDVPESEVAQVKSDFESEGATVTVQKQSDGLFTVTAVWDD